jgi:hypothetical protein
MNDKNNLTITFVVEQSPYEVFKAVNDVHDWWSGNIIGSTNKLNEEWTYRYQDIHYSKHKITELVPDKKVVWHVVDSYISFVDDKEEWTGTDIIFEITKNEDKTQLTFTHKGLVPTVACYEKCAPAWDYYIKDSLYKLITTGKGAPNSEES